MSVHLEELLDLKNATIKDLTEKVRHLETQVKDLSSAKSVEWCRHRKLESDDTALPVPRLEFEWTDTSLRGTWSKYIVEYRMVTMHFLGHLQVIPLGVTEVTGAGSNSAPYEQENDRGLPFRDGAHALHDSSHLKLPLYKVTPSGHVRILLEADDHLTLLGARHRREIT